MGGRHPELCAMGGAPAIRFRLPARAPRDLAVLAGWAAGCLLLSMRLFSWDPHRPAWELGCGGWGG